MRGGGGRTGRGRAKRPTERGQSGSAAWALQERGVDLSVLASGLSVALARGDVDVGVDEKISEVVIKEGSKEGSVI